MSKKQKARFGWIAKISMMFLMVFMIFQPATTKVYAATTSTTKIMPLGDSITDCDFWRTLLFNKLKDNGFNVESVGSQYGNHEGHSGMLVTNLAATNQLTTWLDASNPDIVIMHFGTNDCWGNAGTEKILNAYTKLVAQMRANNPNMIIVVAQIIPMHPNDSLDYKTIISDLDTAMVDWAKELTTTESPIILCDQYTGFDALADTYDGAHPNASGSQKMCNRWYATLSQILSGTVDPTDPTDPVDPVDPVDPIDPVESNLTLSKDINAWGTGYNMVMTVTNNSDEAVSNWSLTVKKADFDISNIWCAEVTESGDNLIITPMSWNATISAGGTTSFGFQGIGSVNPDFEYTLK